MQQTADPASVIVVALLIFILIGMLIWLGFELVQGLREAIASGRKLWVQLRIVQAHMAVDDVLAQAERKAREAMGDETQGRPEWMGW